MSCYNDYFSPGIMSRQPITTPYSQMMQQQGQGIQPSAPPFPTGVPTGPSPMPIAPAGEQAPTTLASPLYTPGYLRTQIGRRMRVEFLIGSNGPLVDRTGTLIGVGTSYILLRPVESDDVMLCDIYSIKFVTILL